MKKALEMLSGALIALAFIAAPLAVAQVGSQNGSALGNLVPAQNVAGRTSGTPAAGFIGERLTANNISSPASLTTDTADDLATVTLTAGVWSCSAVAYFNPNSATTVDYVEAAFNTASATIGTLPELGHTLLDPDGVDTWTGQIQVGPKFYNVSTSTALYLNAKSGFGTNSMAASGVMECVRVA